MEEQDTLATTDFDLERERLDDLATQNAWKLDNQLRVRFYKRAELNTARTQAEGRKIYDEHVYIEILTPANRLNVIDRRVTEEDRKRFAVQFRRFLETGEQLVSGTPLNELAGVTQGQIAEFKALKVDTIEQLANMPDTVVQLLGIDGPRMKQQAQRFLEQRTSNAALSEQLTALRAELETLRAQSLKTDEEKPTIIVGDVSPAKAAPAPAPASATK